MKIGVFYDNMFSIGGAENAAIDLAVALNADLITSGFNKTIYKYRDLKIKVIDIGNLSFKYNKTFGYLIETPLRFFLNRYRFHYDIFIYSGSGSIFGSKRKQNNFWYCHSPNRNLYDLKKQNYLGKNWILKFILNIYISLFTFFDQKIVKNNINYIIANSNNSKIRVKKYYGRDAIVIFPGTNTESFNYNKIGDFYLAVSRLYPIKRIDIVAKAFVKMPKEKIIIIGNGPQLSEIRKIAGKYKNISIRTNVSNPDLIKLYSTCKAVIYIPKNEDFGLVPIESMASGKMCIASNEGGCKETILNEKTGWLINPVESEIIHIVRKINKISLQKKVLDCQNQAKKFDLNITNSNWIKLVNNQKLYSIKK